MPIHCISIWSCCLYVDRTWIGEGFPASNTLDFWLVEMSGIPFGLMSETLDASEPIQRDGLRNASPVCRGVEILFRFGNFWDDFGMKNAQMRGYWDERCPVKTDNKDIPYCLCEW